MTYHLVTAPMTEHRARFAFRLATYPDIKARLVAANVLLPGRSSGDTSPVPVSEVPGTGDTNPAAEIADVQKPVEPFSRGSRLAPSVRPRSELPDLPAGSCGERHQV